MGNCPCSGRANNTIQQAVSLPKGKIAESSKSGTRMASPPWPTAGAKVAGSKPNSPKEAANGNSPSSGENARALPVETVVQTFQVHEESTYTLVSTKDPLVALRKMQKSASVSASAGTEMSIRPEQISDAESHEGASFSAYADESSNSVAITELSTLCAQMLRQLISDIKSTQINQDLIIKTLNHTIQVLERIHDEETRRLCDDDADEITVAQPDKMPNEVRDWLASTFTRSMSRLSNRPERRTFKSIITVIRAGLAVDKLYKHGNSLNNVPSDVLYHLKTLDEWNFNMFQLNTICNGTPLRYVLHAALSKFDLLEKFRINPVVLDNFTAEIEKGYNLHKNPYHNNIHAADVTQTTYHFIMKGEIVQWLSALELLATLMAAAIHDYEHTGTSNGYHVNTGSHLAMLYNDRSVLENHHLSASYGVMHKADCNVLAGLTREEYLEFRSLTIEIVLCTDMAFHFQQIKTMKGLMTIPENMDKPKALAFVVHAADISHPGKSWELHKRWTDMLAEEFFKQGDMEKSLGIPVSPLCDRQTVIVPQSQMGFIDFIVSPTYSLLGELIGKLQLLYRTADDKHAPKLATIRGESSSVDLGDDEAGSSEQVGLCKNKIDLIWMSNLQYNKNQWAKMIAEATAAAHANSS